MRPLSDIDACFQGVIPGIITTADEMLEELLRIKR